MINFLENIKYPKRHKNNWFVILKGKGLKFNYHYSREALHQPVLKNEVEVKAKFQRYVLRSIDEKLRWLLGGEECHGGTSHVIVFKIRQYIYKIAYFP